MDNLDKIKLKDNELIEFAYQRYIDDLNTNFLYIFEIEKYILKTDKQNKTQWIENINNIFKEYMPQRFKDVDKNNPYKFDNITCYKLFLCSYLSPWWSFHYPNLYKYYYYKTKKIKNFNVDLFIGSIEAIFNNDNDVEFVAFEKIVNLKFSEIVIEEF